MPPKTDDGHLKWLEITDFTPGVVTNNQLASDNGGPNGPVPGGKLGMAQSAQGCVAMPNGGLAPLPGLETSIAPPTSTVPISGYENVINGLFATGPVSLGSAGYPGDSVLVGVESIKNDLSERNFYLFDTLWVPHANAYAYQRTLSPTPLGINANYGSLGFFNTMTGALTMANNTASINPTWILSYWYLSGTDTPYVGTPYQWLYPNPTIDSTSLYAFTTPGSNYPAYAFAHESRIVLIQKNAFHWTSSSYLDFINEYFNYTEPPLSISLGDQAESFVPENPTGITAWGSISSAELFCVKSNGGGFQLTGDLNTPTVTRLTGVEPTYGLCSRVAQTPIGLVYLSANHGAWLWNGGSTSQKLSNNIEDNFYEVPFSWQGGTVFPQAVFDGFAADVCQWGDWILFSNDWLFDIQTGGWWQLRVPTNRTAHQWFQTGVDGDILYAAPVVVTSTVMVDLYQRSHPDTQFTWTSYPIRQPTDEKNRQFLVREVVIRCQGNGTVTPTLTSATTATAQFSPASAGPTNESEPVMVRFVVGASGGGPFIAEDIQISVTSLGTSNGPAPLIYSIAVGYEDTAALASPT